METNISKSFSCSYSDMLNRLVKVMAEDIANTAESAKLSLLPRSPNGHSVDYYINQDGVLGYVAKDVKEDPLTIRLYFQFDNGSTIPIKTYS